VTQQSGARRSGAESKVTAVDGLAQQEIAKSFYENHAEILTKWTSRSPFEE
jgi:hypothetical protein